MLHLTNFFSHIVSFLQEIILERLDEKQAGERSLLVTMLASPLAAEVRGLAEGMSDMERVEKQKDLRDRRAKLSPGE